MSRWLEDDKGSKSLGRVISLLGTIAGLFLMVSGGITVLVCLFVPLGKETLAGHGSTLATIGAGVFGASAGLKGWQKASEVKTVEVKKDV